MTIKQNTPLRYPGGKAKFAPFLKKLFEEFNLVGCDYAEPYAGGAGAALELLYSGYSENIHINDIDIAIYNFWYSAVFHTDELLRLLFDTEVTVEEWKKQKHILNSPDEHSLVQHGFSTLFLNRTNRSGILKAGIIGGQSQEGNYKINERFHKLNLKKRLEKIALFSSKIQVSNLDAINFIVDFDKQAHKKSILYLDPPYYVKGQGLYRNFYDHNDHVTIKNTLEKIRTKWIVSYDNCDEIKKIYKKYRQNEYKINYSAHSKIRGSEIIIFGEKLKKFSGEVFA